MYNQREILGFQKNTMYSCRHNVGGLHEITSQEQQNTKVFILNVGVYVF